MRGQMRKFERNYWRGIGMVLVIVVGLIVLYLFKAPDITETMCVDIVNRGDNFENPMLYKRLDGRCEWREEK